jgi:thiamine-phosphate pyrophosphorylase
MAKVAATLGRRARRRKPSRGGGHDIPTLWLMTDPARTPDPAALAARLPRGSGVIYRTFGAADAEPVAMRLRTITRARGVRLLIAADGALAARVGADGVHLPQRMMSQAPGLRRRRPGWLITASAHDLAAIVAGSRWGLDALFVSAVFASRSPSAAAPLGPLRFEALARRSGVPVIALAGIDDATAPRLRTSRASGLAGVEAFVVRDLQAGA